MQELLEIWATFMQNYDSKREGAIAVKSVDGQAVDRV